MSVALGYDRSGNGNNWTVNNLASTDQMVDTPTNNFATLNPLDKSGGTLSEGNTYFHGGSGSWNEVRSSIAVNTGKWYWEIYVKSISYTEGFITGIRESGGKAITTTYWYNSGWSVANNGNNYGILDNNYKVSNGGRSAFTHGIASGNIIGFRLDLTANTLAISVDGVDKGTLYSSLADVSYTPAEQHFMSSTAIANFGQDSSFAGNKTAQGNQDGNEIGDFYYAPPTGFLALCTKNLPDPTVIPSEHFNTIAYAGNSTDRTLTGVGFQPDFSWVKSRSNGTNGSDHWLFDSVRGVNAFKGLCSNGTSVEGESAAGSTQENFGDISAFTSDGFSVYRSTADASHQYEGVNNSSETYVAWNWKAGGAAVSNTSGTITSSVSANVDAGFSVVSYTGTGVAATVGHGLSKKPELIIAKTRSDIEDWGIYHKDIGAGYRMKLNSTTASASNNGFWNSTEPTPSLFTVGTANTTNWSTKTYIAYCFHSVDGHSKVGSYTANGTSDSAFVHLGFRPAYVMIKASAGADAYTSWSIQDSTRQDRNPTDYSKYLWANHNYAEGKRGNGAAAGSFLEIDFTANGFKVRGAGNTEINTTSTNPYIYMAFAEMPFKHSNAR